MLRKGELIFTRCDDPDGALLDDCWTAELKDTAQRYPMLERLFEPSPDSEIDFYVAGKESGPNQRACELAFCTLDHIAVHMPSLSEQFGVLESDWRLATIWVPYQTVEMFFVRFWSGHGASLDYAIKLSDCRYGPPGILKPSNTMDASVASVPCTVHSVLGQLEKHAQSSNAVTHLLTQIRNEEIMGVEILAELPAIVQANRHLLQFPDHYLKLLTYVAHHACEP